MRNLKNLRLSTLTLVLVLSACGSEDPATRTPDTPAAPAVSNAPNPVPVQPPAPTTTAVLDPNPAHGQPGHRCEIPVGASLSTAPPVGATGSMPATNPAITAAPTSPAPVTVPGTTPPGMNPPHGQPGHDCNVAVGAPLPK